MNILIVPSECNKLVLVKLPRPKDGSPQDYFCDEENLTLYEVIQYKDQFRSWFIDNSLCKDGHFNMLTKIDPLYIFLAQLMKQAKEQYRPLNDICQEFTSSSEQAGNGMSRLDFALNPYINWKSICDTKELDGELFVRFSESNTLEWLVKKHKRVMETLKGQIGEQASRATLISYGLDLMDEYVPTSLSVKFKEAVRGSQMMITGANGNQRVDVKPTPDNPKQKPSTGLKRAIDQSSHKISKPAPPKNSIANFFIKKKPS